MTFGETANPDFVFFLETNPCPPTPECWWYKELLQVSNLNLTFKLMMDTNTKTLEQVYGLT